MTNTQTKKCENCGGNVFYQSYCYNCVYASNGVYEPKDANGIELMPDGPEVEVIQI